MSSLHGDQLAREHQKEMSRLMGSRSSFSTAVLWISVLGSALLVLFAANLYLTDSNVEVESLGTSSSPEVRGLLERDEELRGFLRRYTSSLEASLYEGVSKSVLPLVAGAAHKNEGESMSLFSVLYVVVLKGTLHAVFLILACWRIWAAVILITVANRILKYGPYKSKNDLIGVCGNGRLFYSGIRGSLDNVTPQGAPDIQVPGLVCLSYAPDEQVEQSSLYRLIQSYGVANNTTKRLVAHLIKDEMIPSYVGRNGEEGLLTKRFEGVSLIENCGFILENALFLHARYREGYFHDPDFDDGTPEREVGGTEPIRKEENASLLLRSLHRVLTPKMREDLAKVSALDLATTVLAYEAGKLLAWGFEGGRWIRRSNFTELSARAVLHSVPYFGQEYSYDSRMQIRRALIFGSRFSVLGPVRFPTDLTPEARAARQWVEVLMSLPHELQSAADEIELCGIVQDLYGHWSKNFLDKVISSDLEIVEGAFVGPSHALYMPLGVLLKSLREITDNKTIKRLEELVFLVSQKQKLQILSSDLSGDGVGGLPAYQKILPPISYPEMKRLSVLHKISMEDLRDWSALRIVLNNYSWLARRVGNRSVPESSLAFVTFKSDDPRFRANDKGVVGMPGTVPLRGTRLDSQFGKSWANRYVAATDIHLAETEEDYGKLLADIREELPDDALVAARGLNL